MLLLAALCVLCGVPLAVCLGLLLCFVKSVVLGVVVVVVVVVVVDILRNIECRADMRPKLQAFLSVGVDCFDDTDTVALK